jgi:inosine/xanthosine triphosphate pyrophosphatase family protein
MEFLQRSINEMQRELQELRQSIVIPPSITKAEVVTLLTPIEEALTDEESGLAAIHGQATAAAINSGEALTAIGTSSDDGVKDTLFGRANGTYSAVTDTTSGLPKILEHAGNAATSAGEVQSAIGTSSDDGVKDTLFGRANGTYAAVTDGTTGLVKIHEQASNAANKSADALTAIGTMSDPSGQNTLFGRANGTYSAVTDGTTGLVKIHEQASNAARDSGEALTAIGTMSDPSGQNTVFGRANGTYSAVTDGTTGLAKIHARANAAAADAELAHEELVHNAHGLAKIKEVTGSIGDTAVTSSSTGSLHAKTRRLMELTGTEGDLSSDATLFGRAQRITDDTAKISDGTYGLAKIKTAIGSEDDAAAISPTTGSLHAKMRAADERMDDLELMITNLQQLIGTPPPAGTTWICRCSAPQTLFGEIHGAELALTHTVERSVVKLFNALNTPGGGQLEYPVDGEWAIGPYPCPICRPKAVQLIDDIVNITKIQQPYDSWFAARMCGASGLAEVCPAGTAHVDYWASQPGAIAYSTTLFEVAARDEANQVTLHVTGYGEYNNSYAPRVLRKQTSEYANDEFGSTASIIQQADLAVTHTTNSIEVTVVNTRLTGISRTGSEGTWGDGSSNHNEQAAWILLNIKQAKRHEAIDNGVGADLTAYVSYTRPPIA